MRVINSAGVFFALLAVFALALVLVLAVIYIARLMVTGVLLAVAPLALACHALPQVESLARWWWRAFAGVLVAGGTGRKIGRCAGLRSGTMARLIARIGST